MCGFEVVTLPSDADGNTDLDALRFSVGDDLAGLMITLPSTLGLFDANILEVVRIVRDAGGIVYGDGANLNALLGRVKLGELGFDVMHSNLHKTFTQPHGGGGPGAGPVMVGERLLPYLPTPVVSRNVDSEGKETYTLHEPPNTVGRMGAFHGNFGALVRAYAYMTTLGNEGIANISRDAVINANYILSKLKGCYDLPYNRSCMHEVVFSARTLRREQGVSALDVAKRLIDYGIHPPTMYFPLIVEEALMIEPTETESKETLDGFIEVMRAIAQEAQDDPDLLHDAPHGAPNTRLDEAQAAAAHTSAGNPKSSRKQSLRIYYKQLASVLKSRRENDMGLIYAPVTISNPAGPRQKLGRNFSHRHRRDGHARSQGCAGVHRHRARRQREYVLADGKGAKFDTAVARVEFMGEIIGTTIVFGESGAAPLLGAIAMQAAGIVVDPSKETLHKMPSMIRL